MFRQATVTDIANHRITKLHGTLVVVTRFYPRFLQRKLIHDYAPLLAPSKELLTEFKSTEREIGEHNQAFDRIDYESKFKLSEGGLAVLAELASSTNHVYLVCHCKVGDRCHREILMLIAEKKFCAQISRVHFPWEIIRGRIDSGDIFLPA